MTKTLTYFFVCVAFLLLNSCNIDEIQAKNSVEGRWEITDTVYTTGKFSGNTFESVGSSTIQNGQLGYFDFGSEKVAYSYFVGEENFSGIEPWELSTKKVNAGFTRVNAHTLTIGDKFIFDVTFEDDTKNAERKATSMTFIKNPTEEKPIFIQTALLKK
ncbi:MAG: hypothetical protein NWQ46_05070 [Spirosomaceae bacterium]|nr:hypothetical protein [Spirosomataceae bacterium]